MYEWSRCRHQPVVVHGWIDVCACVCMWERVCKCDACASVRVHVQVCRCGYADMWVCMFMCVVCMCNYKCVGVQVCMHVCVRIYKCGYVRACRYVGEYVCTEWMGVCMSRCVDAYVVHRCVNVCVCAWTHTDTTYTQRERYRHEDTGTDAIASTDKHKGILTLLFSAFLI